MVPGQHPGLPALPLQRTKGGQAGYRLMVARLVQQIGFQQPGGRGRGVMRAGPDGAWRREHADGGFGVCRALPRAPRLPFEKHSLATALLLTVALPFSCSYKSINQQETPSASRRPTAPRRPASDRPAALHTCGGARSLLRSVGVCSFFGSGGRPGQGPEQTPAARGSSPVDARVWSSRQEA